MAQTSNLVYTVTPSPQNPKLKIIYPMRPWDFKVNLGCSCHLLVASHCLCSVHCQGHSSHCSAAPCNTSHLSCLMPSLSIPPVMPPCLPGTPEWSRSHFHAYGLSGFQEPLTPRSPQSPPQPLKCHLSTNPPSCKSYRSPQAASDPVSGQPLDSTIP